MTRHRQSFKSTQIFDWDSEPSVERPTDFGLSTGFSALSEYQSLPERAVDAAQRRQRNFGLAKLAFAAVLCLSLCAVAVSQMAHLLQT